MGRSRQKKNNLRRCDRHHENEPPETLPPARDEKDEAEISDDGPTSFFGCYLLTSLSPRYKGHSYIGFTVNPKRRIRQHNGEITSGASRTKRKRPWEMVFCIHGFPTHVAALQFEWAWQHPKESLAVREAASTFKTLGGLANKIKLALTMLTLPSWKSMDLTVSFFSTKYMTHTAGCPSLPRQMKLHFCSMDELPCYGRGDHSYGCDDKDDVDSNHTEEFDHLVDDRQVSSVDTERFTVPNANESIWTWDQRDLDGPLERELCTMVGNDTVEEHEQILQSHPTNVHTENKTKEISTQERIRSFHGIDHFERESSSHPSDQVDSSKKESASHPLLEEDMDLARQFPAGGLRKEMWTEKQRDSSSLLEDLTEPFDQVDPSRSQGQSSSMVIEKFPKKDDMTYVLIDESTNKQRYPTYERLPVRVRCDAVWPSSMEGIEVIDLFTPSPECRVVSGSKKRRVNRDSTDIIDLTRSPLFVRL